MLNVYELVYMSRMGDENALATLLSYCTPIFYKEVKKVMDANVKLKVYFEDFVQEAVITFYYAIDRYREDQEASFVTFVMIVVRRKILTLARDYQSNKTIHIHDTLSLDRLVDDENNTITMYNFLQNNSSLHNPVYNLHVQDCYDNITKAFNDLKPIEKEAFALWKSGKPYAEASKELGISYKAFDGHIQRIKRKIRNAAFQPVN